VHSSQLAYAALSADRHARENERESSELNSQRSTKAQRTIDDEVSSWTSFAAFPGADSFQVVSSIPQQHFFSATILLHGVLVHRHAHTVSRPVPPVQPIVSSPTRVPSAVAPLVLVADGDAVSRDVREAQLRTAGLRVSLARTGFEAIVKASCQMPDVILLDESIVGIEAAETLRMLTICPTTAHIPVLRLLRGKRLPQRVLSRLRRVAA
jgi:CheY-like chemotaxis protein